MSGKKDISRSESDNQDEIQPVTHVGKSNGIGLRAEKSLHAQLKALYSLPGDMVEMPVDGSIVDILRNNLCIEIQTKNFSGIKSKLTKLTEARKVLLVYPVAVEKWVLRQSAGGEIISRRRSPKRGSPIEIFNELVYIPHLIGHPNFSIELVLIQEETTFVDDGKGSWRRKGWSVADRCLLSIVGQILLEKRVDYLALLKTNLQGTFTTRDLCQHVRCRPRLGGKIGYTLLRAGVFVEAGKHGRSKLYRLAAEFQR